MFQHRLPVRFRLPWWAAALALAILALVIITAPVSAQDAVATAAPPAATSVTIPFGDWLVSIANFIGVLAAAIITPLVAWAAAKLPPAIQANITAQHRAQVEQLLARAVDYAIGAVAGAAKDKALDVNVGSAVVAVALQQVIDIAPRWLMNWMGGEQRIAKMIIARLNLSAEASATALLAGVDIGLRR